VKLLLEDGLGLIDLELGLEVLKVMVDAEAIGTTTKVVPVDVLVGNFLTRATPVALAAAVLLGLFGIYTLEAILTKELWAMLDRQYRALGDTGVVLSVCLVRSGHDWTSWTEQVACSVGQEGSGTRLASDIDETDCS